MAKVIESKAESGGEIGRGRWSLIVAAILNVAGIGIAAYLLYAKLRIKFDIGFASSCNLGGRLNCDAVQTSPYSEILGVPVALLAMPMYALMAFLALRGLARARDEKTAADRSSAIAALFGLGALTTVYSVYLAYLSWFVIQALCIFCISMYVIQLASAFLAWHASGRKLWAIVRESMSVFLSFAWPLPAGVLVFCAVLVAGAVGFHQGKAAMIRKSLAGPEPAEVAGHPEPSPQPSPVVAGTTPTVAPQAPRPSSAPSDSSATFFEVPVGPDDYVFGPANAAVTLVDFADFQCSYCRVLASELKKLKTKYADRVRFVFKHFPMNGDCNPAVPGEKMHPFACDTARAAHCAFEQGKFWEMHDKLYENQEKLDAASIEGYATAVGLDMNRWRTCLKDPKTDAKIRKDATLGKQARLNATPTVYVNGRLVRGLAAEILEYHIAHAVASPKLDAAGVPPKAPDANTPSMVAAKTAMKSFYIDAFEASVTADGRAMSLPGAVPAQLNWFEAKAACEKAGKRLCTEEEWVSACAGQPAVDNNNNAFFADDEVEGRMYPYGLFYERGRCRDDEDRYTGGPDRTGVLPGCRTPDGIYDLAGNLGEWTGTEPGKAALLGGDYRGGERSACNRRSATFGAGIKNNTTGFRCCADTFVDQPKVAASDVDTSSTQDVVGRQVPAFELDLIDGGKVSSHEFGKNKLTFVTFFASWCGPCKKELPALNGFLDEFGKQGLRALAIGEDRTLQTSKDFVAQYQPKYFVAFDPDNLVMGKFNVDAMPATFLVDRKGVVRFRHVGFKDEEVPGILAQIRALLAE